MSGPSHRALRSAQSLTRAASLLLEPLLQEPYAGSKQARSRTVVAARQFLAEALDELDELVDVDDLDPPLPDSPHSAAPHQRTEP